MMNEDKAQLGVMHGVGMRASQIMVLCNNQVDIAMLNSQKNDLYNHVDIVFRVQTRDVDTESALAYVERLKWIHHFIASTMLMKTTA